MAIESVSITATWNSITFQEVFALSVDTGGGDREDRGNGSQTGWSSSPGSVSLSCFGALGVSNAFYGIRAPLTITNGGVAYSGFAIYRSASAQPELNGVTRYTVTLNLCE